MFNIIGKTERGSALIEVTLTVPILIIFIVGIYEFGKYFSQMSWLTQTSYNAALVAGEKTNDDRIDELQKRFDDLRPLQERVGLMDADDDIHYIGEINFDDGSDGFETRVVGTLETRFLAFMPLNIPVRSTITAPIMILGDTTSLTGIFKNPGDFAGDSNYGCDNGGNAFCAYSSGICDDDPCDVTSGTFY